MKSRPLHKRLWEKANKTETCWLWTAYINKFGYGVIGTYDKKTALAHRVSFELTKGPIPEGLEINHLCEVKNCINPDHLEAITRAEHILKTDFQGGKYQKNKTHCVNGHSFQETDVYITKEGHRKCRACGRAADKRRSPRRAQAQ